MDNLYRDFKVSLVVVSTICATTIIIDLFYETGPLNWAFFWRHVGFSAYYGIPLTLSSGWFFAYLDRRFPWLKMPLRRALIGVAGLILLAMLILTPLNLLVWKFVHGKAINGEWLVANRTFFIASMLISATATITMHAVGFFREVQRERLVSHRLRQEKLLTELSALRAQVDPHFLFNSFNVLSGLIDEDQEKAQEFLAGLSRIYRYVLEQRNEDTCSVADELAFAQQYLHLQKMRFEDSIRLETTIDAPALQRKIPSLSLQLLLENAVKHNGFDPEHPLSISITAEEDHLVVRNNCKVRRNLVTGNGIGLKNISDRYTLLAQPKPEVIANEHSFAVKLPLI